ncbi:hypothetical protein G6F70_009111 [Rhizopus microsporus]|nr:hypothetical protein G6F71_009077 [Rhizopus microsporus]KAG1193168.1 hypothetical protein G6F70_009111 [Rhizopus microsporus]KAG1206087.1 hypothetical protein G6F69_009084 [Rhizopus microsporus]KAG1226169.1 hypothetical protein G6F67_009087 [Rhizopus microsporus]KAG1257640.1 hypothetical protein G6F68_009209 [Rhizopus microsporus]
MNLIDFINSGFSKDITTCPTVDLPLPVVRSNYLVFDFLCYSNVDGSLGASRACIRPSRRILLQTFDALFLTSFSDAVACALHSVVMSHRQLIPPSPEVPSAAPLTIMADYLLPSLPEWTIDVRRDGPTSVFDVSLGNLRR